MFTNISHTLNVCMCVYMHAYIDRETMKAVKYQKSLNCPKQSLFDTIIPCVKRKKKLSPKLDTMLN